MKATDQPLGPDASAAADPSRRFVLPPDAPYLANLAALWNVDADLARLIEAVPDDAVYQTTPTRSGVPTLSLPGPAGRLVPLHSKYEPVAEAAKLVSPTDPETQAAFYVNGFGLGYHVEALFDRAGDECPIFVFEPDVTLLRTAFELRDVSRLIASRRVRFVTSDDKAGLIVRLQPHVATLSLGVGTVDHGPSLTLHPDFYAEAKRQLDEFASYARTSLNTIVLNGTRTAENVSRNLGWYAASPCASRLKDRFKGRPAVIVSAGPSLRKNAHLLPSIADRSVIVAVQTTLQPLLDLGVEPHFVTSLDYHDISARFFENLPSGRRLRTELVVEPKATPKVLELWKGNVSVLGNDYAEALLREAAPQRASLRAGATVAHLSFYLAEHLGCDPIIFLGQDLGFSDGLFYSPGTSYEDVWRPEFGRFCTAEMKQWDQVVRERFLLRRIPDYQGRPMYTEERLYSYLQQFERDFLQSDRKIIDATEGGAGKRGSTPMPLAEAIETYCGERFEVDLSDHPGPQLDLLPASLQSLAARRDEATEIARLSRDTLPLLEEIRDHLDDQPRVNQAIAKLDALRAKMNTIGRTYDLVTELNQRSQLDRFGADRRIRMAKLDPAETQRRQVERDIANVRSVLEAAERFVTMMDEASGRLEVFGAELRPRLPLVPKDERDRVRGGA